jgi:hypothetical protein
MCFFQKLIGDHYRYAYDALDINPYVQPPLTQQVTHDDGTVEEVIIPTDNALTAGLGTQEDPDEKEMANVAKERDAIKENALKAYSFATHKAERGVLSANPVRLSLALNFSLFTCYCMGELEQAAKMS